MTTPHTQCPNCLAPVPVRYTSVIEAIMSNASEQRTIREVAEVSGVRLGTTRKVMAQFKLPFKPVIPDHPRGPTCVRVKRHARADRSISEVATLADATYAAAGAALRRLKLPFARQRNGRKKKAH